MRSSRLGSIALNRGPVLADKHATDLSRRDDPDREDHRCLYLMTSQKAGVGS